MFAKLRHWICSKICKPKYDAAQIRQDLSEIIYGIERDEREK